MRRAGAEMATLRRRDFVTLMGGTVLMPRPAFAQAAMPVIGVLSSASSKDYLPGLTAFKNGLRESGYVEGQNVKIDYVFANEQYDRLPELATSLAHAGVSIIVAVATPAALALKSAITTIPVVFAISGDPVRTGLVESLNKPGGNFTGAAHMNVEIAPKRLELLHQLLPTEKVMGLLVNPTNPVTQSVSAEVKSAADALGIELQVIQARDDEGLDRALAALPGMKIGALVIGTDPFFTSRADKIGRVLLDVKVPAIYQYREFVAAGGLMSYSGNFTDSYHRAGVYVGRILKGEKPADLPVQLSTKVEFYFNLKSARQLGLSVPLSLTGLADEVIE
jgi:putative tryptophan/tyrosine transport system substrate-binding protein